MSRIDKHCLGNFIYNLEEKKNLKEVKFTKKAVEETNYYLKELEKYILIEEQLGCPIDVLIKVLKQSGWNNGVYFDTVDTDGIERKGMYSFSLDYSNFREKVFLNTGWNGNVWLSDYKKTWWLKETKEE